MHVLEPFYKQWILIKFKYGNINTRHQEIRNQCIQNYLGALYCSEMPIIEHDTSCGYIRDDNQQRKFSEVKY